MMSNKVIVWGCGQMAEVAFFYLDTDSPYQVEAFCMDHDYIKMDTFHDRPVACFEDIEKSYPPDQYQMLMLISYNQMNRLREKKFNEAKAKGYRFISYVSSCATYYGTPVGENTFIMENNVIQPYTKIGNNVVMWSGNHLGHHAVIEDNCFISSHVVISGAATIGQNSFLGVNSTIRDNIQIGKFNLIGAGAVILKDTEDYSVYTVKGAVKLEKNSLDIKHI